MAFFISFHEVKMKCVFLKVRDIDLFLPWWNTYSVLIKDFKYGQKTDRRMDASGDQKKLN